MSAAGGERPVTQRRGDASRTTRETSVVVSLCLEGPASSKISTGLPFFDHMLEQLCTHGGMELAVECQGDLATDAHHSVEDTGIVLGRALDDALAERAGIRRFSSLCLPLDEALVEVALDVSGRGMLVYNVGLAASGPLGSPGFDPGLAEDFLRALASAAGLTLHVNLRYGRSAHHVVEAVFKAFARALRDASTLQPAVPGAPAVVPSSKGVIGS